MLAPVREYFIKDGAALHTWEYDPAWDKKRKTVYEVMRVIDGTPLFLDEHIERILNSSREAGLKDVPVRSKLEKAISGLINKNSSEDGNILLCIIPTKEHSHILSWYVDHYYPDENEYIKGVGIRTMNAIRKQPTAKVWNAELRSKAQYLISESDVYEVLLVDKKKNITEGSRSNIFFIRGDSLFTTPDQMVLQGITRKKILELAKEMMIEVTEREIPLMHLPFYESAFISGTSPGILPVSMIDKHRFNTSNELMRKLMAAYNELVKG